MAGDVEERREAVVAGTAVENTNASAAPTGRQRRAPSIGDSGTPAMNATDEHDGARSRSPSRGRPGRGTAPAPTPATSVIGHEAAARRRTARPGGGRGGRRGTRPAASFRNSDGWKLNEPSATHALASLIVAPTPGTNGSTMPPPARSAERDGQRAPREVRDRACAMSMPTRPTPAHIDLAGEDAVRPVALAPTSVAADADSTMTRPSITNTATMTTIT